MELVTQKFNNEIDESFKHDFEVTGDSLYSIKIKASCKSGKFFGLFGGEDLRVEIDGLKLRELPAKDKPQYYNIPPAWNGTKLKGLFKTVIFVLELKEGKHEIKFIPKLGAVIDNEPSIVEIKNPNDIKFSLNEKAQDGNRRPWITLALIDLPLKMLDASAQCEKRKWDSDDVKLIIDGQVQKNESGNWWGRKWYWQGRRLKGDTEDRRFYLDLEKSNHYIEFWADRIPSLNEIWMYLGIAGEDGCKKEEGDADKEKIYEDPIKIADEFNDKYVLKNAAFNDKDSMSENEIQDFLDSCHRAKEDPHISEIDFNGQKAAYWIKKASEEYNVNPKLLLAKLQAEQRLIKGDKAVNPTKKQLNGAMGVGMFDDGTVIEELQGFVNQMNYAAKYFRQYFNEAKVVDFTHKNVDGKELKTVNAATYSLYRYTPHVAGPKLVYDVYKIFFGTEDLGGLYQKENNEGIISLKLLCGIALSVLILLGSMYFSHRYRKRTVFSWGNEINLDDNGKIITDLEIFSEKKVTEDDGPYCGFRFGKIYQSTARLFLSYDDKVVDSINLTNPELALPDFSEEYLAYYKPWDIDGDGEKQEFVIQEYASCNGNLLSFIKVNKKSQKIEKIPIIYQNSSEGFDLYVDIGEDAFNASNGSIEVKYYNMERGEFIKDYYKFDSEKNKIVWSK